MAKSESFKSAECVLLLWIHEHLRVYADRLTDPADRRCLEDILLKSIIQKFRRPYEHHELFSSLILYSDFLDGHLEMDEREYLRVPDIPTLQQNIESLISSHNMESRQPLELVMFQDAMEHLCRICRVLRQPRGNQLMIGMSGCGKQVLARLGAYICKIQLLTPNITKNYMLPQFR